MKGMYYVATIGMILLIVGGLNWGLVGLFDFDLVAFLFGEMTLVTRIVYALVGLSAVGACFWASTIVSLPGWSRPRARGAS